MILFFFLQELISLHENQCLFDQHMDGASAPRRTFYRFIVSQVYLEGYLYFFKTENVHAMGTRSVCVICNPAHLLKTAFGGTGVNTVLVFS